MRKTFIFSDGLAFLAVTIALFAGAVAREVNLLLFFASLLFCFLFFDRILGKWSLRDLSLSRHVPGSIYAGDSFLMTIFVTNQRKKASSWGLVVEDRIVPLYQPVRSSDVPSREVNPLGYRPVCFFDRVDPQTQEKNNYVGQLPHRGQYQLGPLSVSTRFPLGFFRSSVLVKEQSTLTVFPRLGKLTKNWLREYNQMTDQHHRQRLQASRCSDEPLGIRRWQTGDIQKWIHWRASAKHREIFVRQFQQNRHQDIALILDTYQPEPITPDSFENFELAVSFASTLIKEYSASQTGTLSLVTGGTNDMVQGKAGFAVYYTMMTNLALLEPTDEDHLAEVFQRLNELPENNANILFITSSSQHESFSQRMAPLLSDSALGRIWGKFHLIDTTHSAFDAIFRMEQSCFKESDKTR